MKLAERKTSALRKSGSKLEESPTPIITTIITITTTQPSLILIFLYLHKPVHGSSSTRTWQSSNPFHLNMVSPRLHPRLLAPSPCRRPTPPALAHPSTATL